MDSSAEVHYSLLNRQRSHVVDTRALRRFADRLIRELKLSCCSFSVVFVSDQAMRRYNRVYRESDTPTDVLSFPGEDGYLGDILISAETAYNQAHRRLDLQTSIQRLLLHGLLHLMGYDHETDEGQMRALEGRLRRKLQC